MKNTVKILSAAALWLILFASCKKETPPTIDTTPPRITLKITEQNTSERYLFKSDTIMNGKLNIKPNTKYNYVINVSDTSGLKNSFFRLTKEAYTTYEFGSAPEAYPIVTEFDNIYSYNDTLLGGAYTSLLMIGSFTTPSTWGPLPINFSVSASDYRPSTAGLYIICEINDNPSEGYYGWVNTY